MLDAGSTFGQETSKSLKQHELCTYQPFKKNLNNPGFNRMATNKTPLIF